LLGGETAEMPGFYPEGEYDLAGFAVGAVDKCAIVDGSTCEPGDIILGLESSGLHSNGFSLVRKVLLEEANLDLAQPAGDLKRPLGIELLEPTRIYVQPVTTLLRQVGVKGMAHITGGGLQDNIARILPAGMKAVIKAGSWPVPSLFGLLQRLGTISEPEMIRTFNLGIGFVLIVAQSDLDQAGDVLTAAGEKVHIIGQITKGYPAVVVEGSIFDES